MKKKYFALLAAAVLTGALLTGCSGNAQGLKDGTYRAEMKEASHGYKDYVEVTVKNGKIDTVVFDAAADDGKRNPRMRTIRKA